MTAPIKLELEVSCINEFAEDYPTKAIGEINARKVQRIKDLAVIAKGFALAHFNKNSRSPEAPRKSLCARRRFFFPFATPCSPRGRVACATPSQRGRAERNKEPIK